MGRGIIGIELYGFVIVFDGTVKIASAVVSKTSVVIGHGIIGIELYGFVIVFDGTVKIAFFVGKRYPDCYGLRPNQASIVLRCYSLQWRGQNRLCCCKQDLDCYRPWHNQV